MRIRLVSLLLLVLLPAAACVAQALPTKIRGYKVHNAKVVVSYADAPSRSGADVWVRLAEPTLAGIGLLSAKVDIRAEVTSLKHSGEISLMTFSDFELNGIPVEIAEDAAKIAFKPNQAVSISRTALVQLRPSAAAKGAYREITDRRDVWTVTGTVLVFGRFKRFGLMFKRVIPVPVKLTFKNPLQKDVMLTDLFPLR